MVKSGGRLSLQKHHHRAEHWVVVRGTAKVTVGDEIKTLHENESIYIPIGSTHRLEESRKIDLELIEVQTGVISVKMISCGSRTITAGADSKNGNGITLPGW